MSWTPLVTTLKFESLCDELAAEPIRTFSGKKSRLNTAAPEAGNVPIKAMDFLFSFY
jgi:hypothetical protein